jgi:hypothetical protein
MAHCRSLRFFDQIRGYFGYSGPYVNNPVVLLNNTEELSRSMTTPHDWRTIEELEGEVELVPAKIISELPIAIHRAGSTLREIHINCFPVRSNYSMICPDRQDRLNPAWADLDAACQHLDEFRFGSGTLKHFHNGDNHDPARGQSYMEKYLGACSPAKGSKSCISISPLVSSVASAGARPRIT